MKFIIQAFQLLFLFWGNTSLSINGYNLDRFIALRKGGVPIAVKEMFFERRGIKAILADETLKFLIALMRLRQ